MLIRSQKPIGRLRGELLRGHQPQSQQLAEQPLRTYAATDTGEVALLSFDDLLAQAPPRPPARPGSGGPEAVPKDASINLENVVLDSGSPGFIKQMSLIGLVEGFHVVARTVPGISGFMLAQQLSEVEASNVTQVEAGGTHQVWMEDYGEFNLSGGLYVPTSTDDSLISESILRDRIERYYPGAQGAEEISDWKLRSTVDRRFPLADYGRHGAVNSGDYQEIYKNLGKEMGRQVKTSRSYLEGGNVLTGTLTDGSGYALVGRDSLAVTRAVLDAGSGTEVSQQQALDIVAADLGLRAANVHPVEQGGAFHIDMHLTAVAPGTVVLNDAEKAFMLQEAWLREDHQAERPADLAPDAGLLSRWGHSIKMRLWRGRGQKLERQLEAMQQAAGERAARENEVLVDLRAAGLKVHRLAGCFVYPDNPTRDASNFLNARFGVNEQGQRFYIGLGGEARQEAYVAKEMMRNLDLGLCRMHFLDPELTAPTLALEGGIKCRTKTEGQKVSPEALNQPAAPTLKPTDIST